MMRGTWRFYATAGAVCLVLTCLILYLSQTVWAAYAFKGAAGIPWFFGICIAAAFAVAVHRKEERPARFMQRFMAAFAVKFLLYLAVFLAGAFCLRAHVLPFAAVFFFCFACFETLFVVSLLKQTSGVRKK